MRITGGELKGRRVTGGKGATVRPTSGRVREALFSMIGQELDGQSVLDLFAGSGVFSFEALSRGAERSMLIDGDRAAVASIKRSASELGLAGRVKVKKGRLPQAIPEGERFDLIFMDPPYALDVTPVLERVAPLVGGLLVLEYGDEGPAVAGLELVKSRRYGGTVISLYEATADAP